MAEFKIQILAYEYTVRFIDEGSEDGSIGMCCGCSKEIEIRTKVLDINNKPKTTSDQQIVDTLIHEITHAFDYEAFNYNDFAEALEKVAVLMQKYGREIIKLSDQVFEQYKNYRNAENGKDQTN